MIEFNKNCYCGKRHVSAVKEVIIGTGSISSLPRVISDFGAGKAFTVCDTNTYNAAGKKVFKLLSENNIDIIVHIFDSCNLHCDENAIGSAAMHLNLSCDIIIGIGSGTINDICKIISNISKKPYIIICTAPSMDGYASATSSAIRGNLKTSLQSKSPDVIIGDTDIVKTAPDNMLRAGLGDMLAKYISICEWRIGSIVTGEYYCEEVANLIRKSLKKCVENAKGLMEREDKGIDAVLNGLINSGLAMAYAGVSRPASGIEHYFSHIWDMRSAEFKTNTELHGIQCAVAARYTAKLYEKLKTYTPDINKAVSFVNAFDLNEHRNMLLDFLGESGKAMIDLDKKEQKFLPSKHKVRINRIIANWDAILTAIEDEIPSSAEIENLMDVAGLPKSVSEIGIGKKDLYNTYIATMDIRDKYVLSRLTWDMGVLTEFAESVVNI